MTAAGNRQMLYAKQARVFKALSHPLRVAILEYLRAGERCVCEIAEHVGSERSNVSRHLSLMVSGGVLVCRKEGLKVLYSVKAQCVAETLDCISRLVAQQAKEDMGLVDQITLTERTSP